MEFGRNGAVLRTDEEAERENAKRPGNDIDLCIQSVVHLGGYAALVTAAHLNGWEWSASPMYTIALAAGFACAILPVAFAFAERAIVEFRLPEHPNAQPAYRHIGGVTAVTALLVLIAICVVAAKAAESLATNQEFSIPEYWGDIAITFVAVLFASAIFGPRLSNTPPARWIRSLSAKIDRLGGGLGRLFSVADSWLVFIVAPMVGVTQKRTRVRYGLLFGNIAPCCVAAWFLPSPMGLVPVLWSLLIVTAVARRWAWIEDDREVAMLTGNFSSDRLRVGFDQDLSDETLWSYLSLIALLPIAMHQLNDWGGGHLFAVKEGASETRLSDFWAWLAFYGTELAKSIPFVDWSEIYSVRAASDIVMGAPASRHVIFIVRAVTDLALLAVLLQALAISARTRKQIDLFRDPENPLDRLDPFVEPIELRKLVSYENGAWKADPALIADFPKYNAMRLHELRIKSDENGPIHAAATALLRAHREFSEPIEQLAKIAGSKTVNLAQLGAAWQRVVHAGAYDLETLEYVRKALNRKSQLWDIRTQIVRTIIDRISPSPERTTILRHMLSDRHIKDSLGEIRLMAVEQLFEDWKKSSDGRIVDAFNLASSDGHGEVKTRIRSLLELMRARAKDTPHAANEGISEHEPA